MTSGNRIAIVGAGIAGLACAKVLRQEGFPVEVFDRTPDVGGVWSATRRYPGLRAQNSKHTYHFSDFPMPADYPRVPDGQQMQEYLDGYVRHHGFGGTLRLGTEVVAADPVDSGWLLEIRDQVGIHRTSCDHLIIANGVFSDPAVPDYRGVERFRQVGGQIGHASEFLDVEWARGKSVVVVGYGKSACDIAEAISHVAASTNVVARRLLWKMPRKLARGLIDYERLMLTRMGEAHFRYQELNRIERFLHGSGRTVRESNLDVIQELAIKRSHLRELGLVPEGRFEEIAESTVGTVTDDFFERVGMGLITVHRDNTIAELFAGPHGPGARLADGTLLQADIVVCATGFQQRVPFLTPYVQRQLTDENGNFRLHRQILPIGVPNLSFVGYNSSVISALNAEVAAHWTAALLRGRLALPTQDEMAARVDERLRWMDERTHGHHAHGTAITPFSIHNIDEMLADMKFRLPRRTRAAQWFRTIRPSSYRGLSERSKGATVAPERDHAPAPEEQRTP